MIIDGYMLIDDNRWIDIIDDDRLKRIDNDDDDDHDNHDR
jgi:hypothetical protein